MCGRFTILYTWAEVHTFMQPFVLQSPDSTLEPNYNVAPTTVVPVLLPNAQGLYVHPMRWGLIPHFAHDAKLAYATINARIETIASKTAFKDAWQRRRCVIPISGYYEWTGEGSSKQPYYIKSGDKPMLMCAGIWEHNERLGIDSYSIVTREALATTVHLHSRSPVMLPAEHMLAWVEGGVQEAETVALTNHSIALQFYPVSPAVGNVRNNDPGLVMPLGTPKYLQPLLNTGLDDKARLKALLAIAEERGDREGMLWCKAQLAHLAKGPDSPLQAEMRDLLSDYALAQIDGDPVRVAEVAQKVRRVMCGGLAAPDSIN